MAVGGGCGGRKNKIEKEGGRKRQLALIDHCYNL